MLGLHSVSKPRPRSHATKNQIDQRDKPEVVLVEEDDNMISTMRESANAMQ